MLYGLYDTVASSEEYETLLSRGFGKPYKRILEEDGHLEKESPDEELEYPVLFLKEVLLEALRDVEKKKERDNEGRKDSERDDAVRERDEVSVSHQLLAVFVWFAHQRTMFIGDFSPVSHLALSSESCQPWKTCACNRSRSAMAPSRTGESRT